MSEPMRGLLLVAMILFVVAFFLLPSIIAVARRVERLGLVIALNIIAGPTLIGWPAALLGALMLPSRRDAAWSAPESIYRPGDPPPIEHVLLADQLRRQRMQSEGYLES
ncbi:superinfection immunity protein [Thermomonospora umbrina]|uniref:T4 superinfection immunity protein n=1 Tax=Thermomonospora umbrina TaxID=111806 RepID=A0A3D9T0Y8_9ACTN|nr:superinfection immunity protein [Thermomonospora umbrina]REF00481.1 T4 superinfection immunity protein [Thermomonospora umbrina]